MLDLCVACILLSFFVVSALHNFATNCHPAIMVFTAYNLSISNPIYLVYSNVCKIGYMSLMQS